MRQRSMSRVVAIVFSLALLAGCTTRDEAPAADPNRPAVVQAPAIILPSDTATPDTMPAHRERMRALANELVQQYAVVGAGIGFRDPALIRAVYAPDAVVVMGDSTFTGVERVASALVDMGRRTGVSELLRSTRSMNRTVDSIYLDSGYYIMRASRPGGGVREERGSYVSTWRHLGGSQPWVLRRDELRPLPPPKR